MGCGLISHHIKIDAKNQGSRDENCGGVLGCLLACSISPDKKVLAAEKKHRLCKCLILVQNADHTKNLHVYEFGSNQSKSGNWPQ